MVQAKWSVREPQPVRRGYLAFLEKEKAEREHNSRNTLRATAKWE